MSRQPQEQRSQRRLKVSNGVKKIVAAVLAPQAASVQSHQRCPARPCEPMKERGNPEPRPRPGEAARYWWSVNPAQ
ncbi:hypothetical protein E2C01_042430 [Portunus trituberculatus]|uniref:Uncharacterized protein n=1 Tax=Portunus trituberculatus TaxID=210409 RepID=A0A5B7FTN4_PORTR|nr:hypothetical protein [Portunus trituberculatus]